MPRQGTITVTDDDLAPAQLEAKPATPTGMPTPPSPTWWDRVNKGMISPDAFLKWASGGKVTSVAAMEKNRDQPPTLKETPGQAFKRTFWSGVGADEAKTASALTSPASIAMSVGGQAAKIPGTIGKLARTAMTAGGLGFGALGTKDIGEGIQEGIKTPGGAQKVLAGGAQVAGAAPAVAQVGRTGTDALAKVAPQLFAKGEGAFVAALAPTKNAVPKLRQAYQRRAADLKASPVKDLPGLHNYAEVKRVEAAQELTRELGRVAPGATRVDAQTTAAEIRNRVTKGIELSSPAEARAIRDYAQRVEQELLQHPLNLGQAESLVQELNARSASFDKLPPEAQRQQLSEGSPILGEKALKEALQDQIEAKLSNYRDLKRRYGDWKEIQNQTQSRIDELERHGTNVSYAQRRALESLMGAGGMLAGSSHGGGMSGGILGGAGGYLISRFAADQILSRLSTPEHALNRGIRPTTRVPLPFAGQVVQPAAAVLTQKEDQP